MKYILLGFILIILIFILKKHHENFTQEGIFKKKPFPKNSIKIGSEIRKGVLMNLRPEIITNTYSYEINYNDMNRLLSQIKGINFSFVNTEDFYQSISKDIVERINNKYFKLKLNHELHLDDNRRYELINYDILKDDKISKITNKCVLDIQFHKYLKDISYTIQVRLKYSLETLNYIIDKIDIIGIDMNEHILMDKKNKLQKYCSLKYDNNLVKCHGEELIDEKEFLSFFDNTKNKNKKNFFKNEIKFFNEKEKEKNKHETYKKFKCFNNDGFNESTCNSYSFITGKTGTWDKPCEVDVDCPFFKANKNYPSSRGGCINGYC